MSVGIGECPNGSKTSTALSVAPIVVDTDSLDSDAVEQVDAMECDAIGLQECARFTLGPDENPQLREVHQKVKDQHGCSYDVQDAAY